MSIKRTATAAGIFLAAALTLSACSTGEPTEPTTTPSDSPEPTPVATYAPPADEAEAITAAEGSITRLLEAQSEINAAGGEGAERYEDLASGNGLDVYQGNADAIANGPYANEDGENVDGQSISEGIIVFEEETAYGQELNGIPNGLVLLPGCLDTSGYTVTTADGKPAYRADSDRNKVEFQVSYDADRKLWLVSDLVEFPGETC